MIKSFPCKHIHFIVTHFDRQEDNVGIQQFSVESTVNVIEQTCHETNKNKRRSAELSLRKADEIMGELMGQTFEDDHLAAQVLEKLKEVKNLYKLGIESHNTNNGPCMKEVNANRKIAQNKVRLI